MSTTVSHVWKPSSARLVIIDSFIPVPRGTTAIAPPPLNWPTKDPGDVLDYILDIGPAIVGNDGDAIETLSVSATPSSPGDLVIQSTTTDGSRIVLWLAEGQAGTVYTVTFAIGTINGRSLQRSVLLPVLMLSVPPIPPQRPDHGVGGHADRPERQSRPVRPLRPTRNPQRPTRRRHSNDVPLDDHEDRKTRIHAYNRSACSRHLRL